jgi:hypothetical protein
MGTQPGTRTQNIPIKSRLLYAIEVVGQVVRIAAASPLTGLDRCAAVPPSVRLADRSADALPPSLGCPGLGPPVVAAGTERSAVLRCLPEVCAGRCRPSSGNGTRTRDLLAYEAGEDAAPPPRCVVRAPSRTRTCNVSSSRIYSPLPSPDLDTGARCWVSTQEDRRPDAPAACAGSALVLPEFCRSCDPGTALTGDRYGLVLGSRDGCVLLGLAGCLPTSSVHLICSLICWFGAGPLVAHREVPSPPSWQVHGLVSGSATRLPKQLPQRLAPVPSPARVAAAARSRLPFRLPGAVPAPRLLSTVEFAPTPTSICGGLLGLGRE